MSRSIQVLVAPSAQQTRLLVREEGRRTLLRATLSQSPSHPRALSWFLEALALWEGATVRGVLVVDASDRGSASTLCRDVLTDFGTPPLYSLEWVTVHGGGDGWGRAAARADFRDLARLEIHRGAR